MKKGVLYISFAAVLLMLLAGCSEDLLVSGSSGNADGTTTVKVSMTIPATQSVATRALADIPDASLNSGADATDYLSKLKLYIFVFEDAGSPESNYLRELVYEPKINSRNAKIEQEGTDLHPGTALLEFNATFDGTAENAIVHIVATADPTFEDQLRQVEDRSELGMMSGASGLYSSDGEAYWTRVELGMPINSDNIDAIGAKLSHLKMIRNFARVTLKVADNKGTEEDGYNNTYGFEVDGFVVVNAANRGYVAVYNENGKDGAPGFMTDFAQPDDNTESYYDYLSREQNYVPARHPLAGRINPDDSFGWITDGVWTPTPKYMFERPLQDNHKTFVIVKGHFPNGGDRYIKLDIGTIDRLHIDEETQEPFGVFESFNIVRNISYDITIINMANAGVGHTSAESAIVSPPSNNISASIETRDLHEIYDGVDFMQVNATTVVIVDKEDENGEIVANPSEFDMKWRYYKGYINETSRGSLSNETVKWNFPEYAFEYNDDGTAKNGGDPTGIISSTDAVRDMAAETTDKFPETWRGFHLKFNNPDKTVRQKTVRLYSPFGLTRDVNFIMRQRWEFVANSKYNSNVEVYPGFYSFADNTMPSEKLDEVRELIPGPGEVGSQRGAQLTVMFELPDDIPQALFPLDFTIGFDRQNVENAYVGNAIVKWGESMFEDDEGGVGVPRMQFVKTVDWLDYNGSDAPGDNGHKIVTARFMTTTDVLASNESDTEGGETSTTRVRVTNPYFIMGQDDFLRSAKDDENIDPDPNRTLWSWYFGDPGWLKYFETAKHDESGNYAELWYNSHTWTTRDGYAMQMAPGHGQDNPEFKIDFDASKNTILTAGKYSIKLTLTGASLYFKYNDSGISHQWDEYFRRRAVAKAIVKTKEGTLETRDFPVIPEFKASVPRNDSAVHAYFEGIPEIVHQTLDIGEEETLVQIIIYSDPYDNDTNSGNYVATLWYGIRCEIIPN